MKQNRTLIVIFSLCALVFGFVPNTIQATMAPDVIISEVMWAGSSVSAADEWIELTNMSNQPVDVSGWSLTGASSAPIIFPDNSFMEPHTPFLISNYAHTNTNSTLNTQSQIVTTMVSLPNDKLALTLTAPNRGMVDSAGNGGAPFAGTSGGTGDALHGQYRSMERRDFLMDGTTKDAWTDADSSNGFKESALDQGTPGSLNADLQSLLINTSTPTTPIAVAPATPIEQEQICEDVAIDLIATVALEADVIPQAEPTSDEIQTLTPAEQPALNSKEQNPPPQGTLRISEIYSHPATGESEWIEFENTSSYPVTTNGWNMLDASGASTLLPDVIVSPGTYLTIENPKGKLNNDSDSVTLKDANGSVIESVLYHTDLGNVPDVNESLVRINEQTFALTTTPTKNTSNTLTPRPPKTSSVSNTTTQATTTSVTETIATNTEIVSSVPHETEQPTKPEIVTEPEPSKPILKTLRLSAFYPNTGGNDLTDEYIEIENTGDQPVVLDGWKIVDAGGTKFTFTKDTQIAAYTFHRLLRPETKISLNNDSDTVTLIAPDGSIIDTQTYEQAKSQFAFARSNNVWSWTTTITPNEPSVVSENSSAVSTTSETRTPSTPNTSPTTQSSGSISPSLVTIEDAKLHADGTRMKVRGVVTALPNTFNSQTMYIQDDTGGIQIFKSDCRFPTLALGQSITVTGVLSHINGEARLKVMNQTSLTVGSITNTVSPTSGNVSSIGSLMTIAGTITSKSGTRLALDVDGETWNVDLPKTNTATYKKGESITVSGILANAKNGPVLKARSEQDVTPLPKADTKQSVPNITATESTEPKQTLAIVLILLSSLAFIGLKLRPRFYAFTQSYGRKPSFPPRA